MICLLNFLFTLALAKPFLIVIDPGHGGTDAGAVRGSLRESDIALKVSENLQALLNNSQQFKATLTREADKNISLQDRVKIANTLGADLFLSIHLNATADGKAQGVEFYFQNHLPADEEALFLASTENMAYKDTTLESNLSPTKKNDVISIIEDLKRHHRVASSHQLTRKLVQVWAPLQSESQDIKQAPFYVVSKAKMPAVLIELGFVSNHKEAERLNNNDYQKLIAQQIFEGLHQYKEMMDKNEAPSLQ